MGSKALNRESRNSVRIIAGAWRSRKVMFPSLDGLRPTGDRIRETLFNWLQLDVPGSRCLDLFAGSGVLGFEALSRGASKVVLVEKDPAAARQLRETAQALESVNAEIFAMSAQDWLAREDSQPFHIVFLDPPYTSELLIPMAQALSERGLVDSGSKIYLEAGEELQWEQLPSDWRCVRKKRAGEAHFYLAEVET